MSKAVSTSNNKYGRQRRDASPPPSSALGARTPSIFIGEDESHDVEAAYQQHQQQLQLLRQQQQQHSALGGGRRSRRDKSPPPPISCKKPPAVIGAEHQSFGLGQELSHQQVERSRPPDEMSQVDVSCKGKSSLLDRPSRNGGGPGNKVVLIDTKNSGIGTKSCLLVDTDDSGVGTKSCLSFASFFSNKNSPGRQSARTSTLSEREMDDEECSLLDGAEPAGLVERWTFDEFDENGDDVDHDGGGSGSGGGSAAVLSPPPSPPEIYASRVAAVSTDDGNNDFFGGDPFSPGQRQRGGPRSLGGTTATTTAKQERSNRRASKVHTPERQQQGRGAHGTPERTGKTSPERRGTKTTPERRNKKPSSGVPPSAKQSPRESEPAGYRVGPFFRPDPPTTTKLQQQQRRQRQLQQSGQRTASNGLEYHKDGWAFIKDDEDDAESV